MNKFKLILYVSMQFFILNNIFSQNQNIEAFIPNVVELEIYNVVLLDALENPRYEDFNGIFLIDIQLSNRIIRNIQNNSYFDGIEETLLQLYNDNNSIIQNFNIDILFNIRFYWYQEFIKLNGNLHPRELISKGIFPHVLKLSKISFNDQKNQAFLYLEHGRIPLASCGEYIYMKKINNEWKIEKILLAWIS